MARPKEDNVLEWRFLIKGAEGTDYEGGYYHGKLIFPPQYPMKPPGIMFCTPSGRFEINKRVCLTISDFHPETWSPLWTVGSILTGIVSFMNSDELTTGGLAASSAERKSLAMTSTAYNAKDKIYIEVFGSGPPLELFQESEARLNEITKKRLEKSSQAPSSVAKKIPSPSSPTPPSPPAATTSSAHTTPTSTTMTGTVRSSVDVEGEKGGTVALSKSAKKRAKEKEKARRQKEAADNGISYVAGSNDGSDDEGDDINEANDLVADMKISGDDR